MIKIDNVSYKYSSSKEENLHNINLTIKDGEVIVLLGPSGCGKTTVTRLINRLAPEFYDGEMKGKVYINGEDTSDYEVQDLTGKVGSVFQDPRSQFFATDSTAEIAFSCENLGMERKEINSRILKAVKDLNIKHLLERSLFELSSGEKQAIAIASVYALSPRILVLDEPSANLDAKATKHLEDVLSLLKKDGFTIVISEHRIHYLKDLVDRAILFNKGRIVKELDKEEFQKLSNKEANDMGLRSINLKELLATEKDELSIEEQIAFNNVSFSYKKNKAVLSNITFSANKGDIVGVIGHNGVGKSTLLDLITGLRKESSGTISINKEVLKAKKRNNKTYLVMQDSDYQLFSESVEKELYLENEKNKELMEKGSKLLKFLSLDSFLDSHPASLSGGQKQRLCIAVACLKNSSIICFDEPTSGLDYENMKSVSHLLTSLSKEGKTLFVTTHDYEFLLQACTHILYLDDCDIKDYFKVNKENAKKIYNILENIS